MSADADVRTSTGPGRLSRVGLLGTRAWRALPLLCLICAWIGLRRGFLRRTDIPLWDETEYLAAGWRLLHHGDTSSLLPGSPLYLGWYALWHLLVRDATAVLYAQWLTVDLGIAVASYLVMRASGVGRIAATLTTTYFSLLVFSSDQPRVGFLAFLLVLIAGLCESRGKRLATGALLAGAVLVRPEYLLALLVWMVVQAWPRVRSRTRWLLAGGLGATLLLGALATFSGIAGARPWTAFGQHYALRWAERNPSLPLDPWTDHAEVVASVFPGATSLGDALRVNPGELLRHVFGNLADTPGLLVTLVLSPALPGRLLGPLLLVVMLLAGALRRSWPQLPSWRTPPVVWIACASVVPSLLAKPKAVYALPLVWLVLLGLTRLGRSLLPAEPLRKPWAVGLAWAGLALLPWALPVQPARPLPVAETITHLQSLWSQQPAHVRWRMLEQDGGWCTYLDPERCTAIWLWEKPVALSLQDFLSRQNVNAVMVSPAFLRSLRARNDAELTRFQREPAACGFREFRLGHGRTLYLQEPPSPSSEQ